MGRPVLLAVDDDAPVLAAVERDLRDRYAEQISTWISGLVARVVNSLPHEQTTWAVT